MTDDVRPTFAQWLAQHRSGLADAELTDLLETVVESVGRSTKKNAVGSITLKLRVRAEGDMVAITDHVAHMIPDETEARLYWVALDGTLTRNNPLQPSLLPTDDE